MTKHELQSKGVETLERIAEAMEENGRNTLSILKKHADIAEQKLVQSENKSLYFNDENQRKLELHKMPLKELQNMAFFEIIRTLPMKSSSPKLVDFMNK
jgi:hypothetical protein